MSRQWTGVPAHALCQQHLLGEHAEHHRELGSIRAGHVGSVRGHIEHEQFYPALAQSRHGDLAAELGRRGMNHDSPLDAGGAIAAEPDLFRALRESLARLHQRNRRELADRCDDCRDRLLAAGVDTATGMWQDGGPQPRGRAD